MSKDHGNVISVYVYGLHADIYSVLCICKIHFISRHTTIAGKGLIELMETAQLKHFLFGTHFSSMNSKCIYQHGTLRKVLCILPMYMVYLVHAFATQ